MPPRPRKKDYLSRIGRELKRAERRVLIAWIRFAKRHRQSNWLPLMLFLILFMDGFVLVIPSMLVLVAAVTISPKRWWMFAAIFVAAVSLNNTVTYYIGRSIPLDQILYWIKFANAEAIWTSAKEAIRENGKYATLLGALAGLPTQMITMLIGAADRQLHLLQGHPKTSLEAALIFGAIGHGVKVFVLCGLIRYGWVKLEKKMEKSEGSLRPPAN